MDFLTGGNGDKREYLNNSVFSVVSCWNKFIRVVCVLGVLAGENPNPKRVNSRKGRRKVGFPLSGRRFESATHSLKLFQEESMPDFKLISADGHINEPPAAWERVQEEFGDRAPKVVKDPEGFKGIWVITDGLPPSPCSNYSIGHVVSKPGGLAGVELNK